MDRPSPFFQKSFISINQIHSKRQIDDLFKLADLMKEKVETHTIYEPLKGKSIAILFYQPSTRTFSAFVAASQRLGAYTTAIHGMKEFSSVTKGESLEDTIRSIQQTTAADLIILRHPDDASSEVAAKVSPVPVINAGSGTQEHPTQALLDLYTIYHHLSLLQQLHVVMVGDLLYGRTVKSLAKLLLIVNGKTRLTFISPSQLAAPRRFVKELQKKFTVIEKNEIDPCLKSADVIYMTRVQREWFENYGKLEEYEQLKNKFILTRHMAGKMKKTAIIMHPLPRVGEILYEVDDDHRAKYFEQMRSGLYIRMALIQSILTSKIPFN